MPEPLKDEHYDRRLKVSARTSSSQIELWEKCPRKWFNDYICGLKTPATAAQLKGTEIDLAVQHYLHTGEIRGAWTPLLERLAPFLPAPCGSEVLIQEKIELPTFENGPLLIGYPDFAEKMGALCTKILFIGDLKSTSDFRYCKTREQLESNRQLMTYARWGYAVMGADEVRIGHVYGCTKKPKACIVPADDEPPISVSREHVNKHWETAMACVREMVNAALYIRDADELSPNTAMCNEYGGCPHRSKCGLSAIFPKRNTRASNMSKMLEKLNKGKPVSLVSVPVVDMPAVIATTTDSTVSGRVVFDSMAVLPPDAPSRESTPEEVAALVEAAQPKRGKRGRPKEVHLNPFLAEETPASEPLPSSETLKDDPKMKQLAEMLKQPEAEEPKMSKQPATRPTLFVDCMPMKGGGVTTHLEEWLAPIAAETARAGETADWRLIPYTSKGMLAHAIRQSLDTCPSYLVIDSRTSGAEVALEVLIPHAALVIRGMR